MEFRELRRYAKVCVVAVAAFAGSFGGSAMAKPKAAGLDGIYVGYMDLADGFRRKIPLSVSLVVSNEVVDTPRGSEYVIDGSCVIDEEGGPYAFVRVGYDLDDNTIDLRYSRPRSDPNTVSPASFRLTGSFKDDDTIEGRVLSGSVGIMGTFKIVRDPNIEMLKTKDKYVGVWKGEQFNHFSGKNIGVTYFIGRGVDSTDNPSSYEFDFTPGRIAGYKVKMGNIDDISVTNFTRVAIDYLRQRVLLQDFDKAISVQIAMDFTNGTITGSQYSGMHGLTATFKGLPRLSTAPLPPDA